MVLSQRSSRLLILFSLFALLGGCATDSGPRRPAKGPGDQAGRLAAAGDYSAAAAQYERLARGYPAARASDYLIQAAHYYTRAGQIKQAELVYARIKPATLTPPRDISYAVLQAHLDVLRGKPQQALDRINGLPSIPRASVTWAWEVRADASAALGDSMGSLRARIELDRRLIPGARKKANQEALWQTLQGLADSQLDALQAPSNGAVLAGWASLALVYRNAPSDSAGLKQAILTWQAQHATHPAAKGFANRLAERSQQLLLQPGKIAVLLPTSGRYAAPAGAVRDGIVAAWYAQPTATRPELRFYSVPETAAQVINVYRTAISNGAESVIGPLRKEAVTALANSGTITVPTLALNRVLNKPAAPKSGAQQRPLVTRIPPNLYQFGLAPEDDASGAARQAAKDGRHQAVALVPVGDKGERISAAFALGMKQSGGVLLETQRYNTSHESPFSDPIKRVLNLDSSSARRRKLENLLGENLEFEPSRRSDIDYVFLYARPVDARQIIPQLAFFNAAGVPIYATTDAFDGRPNRDVEGLVFPTMPWQSAPAGDLVGIRRVLQEYRSDVFASFDRLYALGIDAYRLTPRLPRLRSFSRETAKGASGLLSIDANGVVHRDPLWARVHRGRVDLYTVAPQTLAETPPGAAGETPESGQASGTPLPPPEPILAADSPADYSGAPLSPAVPADHDSAR